MTIQASAARLGIVCLLLVAALSLLGSGCSSDDPGQSTTTSSSSSSTTDAAATSSTVTSEQLMSGWDQMISETSDAQHGLAVYLKAIGASEDDPQRAMLYGLKARINALSCRKALEETDMELADSAMQEVYAAVNVGLTIATGSTAQTLTDARAIIESLGAPSDGPGEAAILLDQFIDTLTPLMDEARAILSSTTTTTAHLGAATVPSTTSP